MKNWLPVQTAPRDGRPIIIAVLGRCELGTSNFHELQYPVRWLNGRWVYARNNSPVFDWHKPMRWREGEMAVAA